MAAAIYNKITNTSNAFSAGTYVGARDAPDGALIRNFFRKDDFFQVMEEKKLLLRNNTMKKLSPKLMSEADIVISMAEEPFIPEFLKNSNNVIWWEIDNPKFVNREIAEKTYSQIYKLIEELVTRI